MKRKLICLILALTMLAALAACGSANNAPAESPAPSEAPALTETPAPEPSDVPDKTPDGGSEPAEPAPDESGGAEPEDPAEKPAEPSATPDTPASKPDDKPAGDPAGSDQPAVMPDISITRPEQPAGDAVGGTASADAENGALALLQKAWAAYPEDDKFAAAGGDYSEEHMVDGGPGIYGIADGQQLNSVFGVPSGSAAVIDGAASLMHMMNANTFTCGAFHIKSGEDASAFAQSLKDSILQRHWMCGFPDKVVIYSVGDYIVSAFGNAELLDTFFSALVSVESSATLLYDEPIE